MFGGFVCCCFFGHALFVFPFVGVWFFDASFGVFFCQVSLIEAFWFLFGEFDPGSGRTLAACLTHASRTESAQLAG